jgi:hypothetical protein
VGWILVDGHGNEQQSAVWALKDELKDAENQYYATVRKANEFRREQKMLQKTFRGTVERCMKEGNARASKPIQYFQGTKHGRVSLTPLNSSTKRKATSERPRHSTERRQDGLSFLSSQKK